MISHDSLTDRIAAFKVAHPLSSIIGEYVDLKRCGRELRGCCPFHQERTPSFYVNDEKGTYHCFGCGVGGDHINFVRDYMNLSATEALEYLNRGMPSIPYSTTYAPDDRDDRSQYARAIWERCGPIEGTPAEKYLEKRAIPMGIAELQQSLRFGLLPLDGSGEYPALVCAVQNKAGEVVGIQRIYLTPEGDKLDGGCKRTLGLLRGSAVRIIGLHGPSVPGHVYLTEGVEDALSVGYIQNYATVWATLGTSNLSKVELPDDCTHVTIAHDNDEAGRFAALEAASRFAAQGREVSLQAPNHFKEWNEHLVFWENPENISYYNELPWRMSNDMLFEHCGGDHYTDVADDFLDGGQFHA